VTPSREARSLTAAPVAQSSAARIPLFLASLLLTAAVVVWARQLPPTDALTPIFYVLFRFFDYSAGIVSVLILIVAVLVPNGVWPRTLLRWLARHPGQVAAATGLLLCIGTIVVYRNHPLSMDEYAPYFQSQVFAAGRLSGRLPPALLDWLVPPSFQDYFLNVSHATGAVASAYWPSFALLLTPFTLLGIPWACNPCISALTLLAIHRLALHLFKDQEAAGLAVLLTVASPVFFANGISYYSMPAHLLANAVYALLLVEPTPRKALVAGVVGSVALTLHNPVPHMLFALPWLVYLAMHPQRVRLLGGLAAGYLPLCLLLGVGWFAFSADIVREAGGPATSARWDAGAVFESAFHLPTGTVLLARLIGLAKVWLWAVPGLLLLAGAGAWKWRRDARCLLLATSALVTLLGYLFVPVDQGHGWGYRYFHSAWFALPLLAAGALQRTEAGTVSATALEADDVRAFVVACSVLTLLAGVGFRSFQIHEFIVHEQGQVPAYAGRERRVVILDTTRAFYGQDLVQNDPFLRGPLTRMLTHGADADAQMMTRNFPDMRRVFADEHGTVWAPVSGRPTQPRDAAPRPDSP
jgi:hypothetical protein